MATSAFKSTTKRSPIGASPNADDSGSSIKAHRRSRSLSRFSRRTPNSGDTPAPRGRFVNTVRGSGFPEISLDDLAIEFFSLKDSSDDRESDRDRSSRRCSEMSPPSSATVAAQRRGRSVSRQSSRAGDGKRTLCDDSHGGMTISDANSRRRRSVSVVRCQISDSECDIDHSQISSNHTSMKNLNFGNSQTPSVQKPTTSSNRRLGRSLSQKDLSKMHGEYSSRSSALTDDEARDDCSSKNMVEKTIRAVYAQKKADHPSGDDVSSGLYEAMRKELRYAVDKIRMELEQAMARKTSALASGNCLQSDNDFLQTASTTRKNYAKKLEQSQKRKQDLLAEIVLEEEHGRELSKIVRESLPNPKSSTVAEKPSQVRKRSNDRNRMSERLTEEAEKYFEDFISNVEDTDISSFDGERSDASSTLGVIKTRDSVLHFEQAETFQNPAGSNNCPVEMDGVILPWLQWETGNDSSPLPSKNKRELPVTPKSILWDAAQDAISERDRSVHSPSSRGSWSSVNSEKSTVNILERRSHRRSEFDMEKYLNLKKEEDLMLERWREQGRINSGGLLLCRRHVYI
ncbi:uncharacterized protein LOC130767609 isoform X1 [Actinidia eriantha]|uniref:uncharacterized protein LOC130767609 isoform X1 n=1 Tax=Actinidia eriantha TaxID=165200 RepID=UPI00258E229B|nr:uncharacterized protein LOC130767609 isoform X1 [Actinidia eriantha]